MKSKRNIRLMATVVLFIALVVGGYFGFRYYQNIQTNRIYAIDDKISFPDFDLKVKKAEFKPVNLPLDDNIIKKYGGLEEHEDCDKLSKSNTWWSLGGTWNNYGPSEYNICVRRNDSRDAIHEYKSKNKQLVVDYELMANRNVSVSSIKIGLMPDSGRKLGQQVDDFNANQFFPNGAQEKTSLYDSFGVPGPVFTDEWSQHYKPYYKSSLGGDINKGLKRAGYIYADIRNYEKNVDIKITYKKDSKNYERIVRVKQ